MYLDDLYYESFKVMSVKLTNLLAKDEIKVA